MVKPTARSPREKLVNVHEIRKLPENAFTYLLLHQEDNIHKMHSILFVFILSDFLMNKDVYYEHTDLRVSCYAMICKKRLRTNPTIR